MKRKQEKGWLCQGQWMKVIVLIISIGLTCVCGASFPDVPCNNTALLHCYNLDDPCGFILPNDPNVTLDISPTPLNVTCTLRKKFMESNCYNSSHLFFMIKNSDSINFRRISQNDVTLVNKRTARLETGDVRVNDVHIRCYLQDNTGQEHKLSAQIIDVGRVPSKPVQLEAVIDNWGNMTISWEYEMPNTHYKAYYVAWWRAYDKTSQAWPEWRPCHPQGIKQQNHNTGLPSPHEQMHCVVSSALDAFDERELMYKVNVTNHHQGYNTSEVIATNITQLIKPTLPPSLLVYDKGSTWMELLWHRSHKVYNFVYRVNYTCRWADHCPQSYITDEKGEITPEKLTGLHPYTEYIISVESKYASPGAVFWSDPALLVFTTNEDKPSASPPVLSGSYWSKLVDDQHRDVTIFWKAVPEEHRNGNISHYTIKMLTEVGQELTTLQEKVPGSDFSFTIPRLRIDMGYNFYVCAGTGAGIYDIDTTAIRVHASRYVSTLPAYKLVAQTDRELLVSWDAVDNLGSLFVYWCKAKMHQQSKCPGEISWKSFEGQDESGILDLGEGASYKNMMFGVSAEFKVTSKAWTGIEWTECVYDTNKVPNRPKEISEDPFSSTQVKFRLQTSCKEYHGLTRQYRVLYCEYHSHKDCNEADMNTECEGEKKELMLDLEPNGVYTIDSLSAETQYLISAEGRSENKYSIPNQFCLRTTPQAWYMKTWVIVLCSGIGLILLILFLIGAIQCLRQTVPTYRRVKEFTQVNIETPGGDEFLPFQPVSNANDVRFNKKTCEVTPMMIREESIHEEDEEEKEKIKAIVLDPANLIVTYNEPNSGHSSHSSNHKEVPPQERPSCESNDTIPMIKDDSCEPLIINMSGFPSGEVPQISSDGLVAHMEFDFDAVPSEWGHGSDDHVMLSDGAGSRHVMSTGGDAHSEVTGIDSYTVAAHDASEDSIPDYAATCAREEGLDCSAEPENDFYPQFYEDGETGININTTLNDIIVTPQDPVNQCAAGPLLRSSGVIQPLVNDKSANMCSLNVPNMDKINEKVAQSNRSSMVSDIDPYYNTQVFDSGSDNERILSNGGHFENIAPSDHHIDIIAPKERDPPVSNIANDSFDSSEEVDDYATTQRVYHGFDVYPEDIDPDLDDLDTPSGAGNDNGYSNTQFCVDFSAEPSPEDMEDSGFLAHNRET